MERIKEHSFQKRRRQRLAPRGDQKNCANLVEALPVVQGGVLADDSIQHAKQGGALHLALVVVGYAPERALDVYSDHILVLVSS
jgi:hypothetical protein